MRTSHTRYAIVLGLILLTGVSAAALRVQRPAVITIPAVGQLTSGTGWVVGDTYVPAAFTYRQWLLRDPSGHEALLYVAASSRSVPALVWTGELGYQGAGYEVARTGERRITLGDGSSATVNDALVHHLSDTRLLLYAVASPRGVLVHRLESFVEATWDAVGGDPGPYFMVRVSVPVGTSEAAASPVAANLLGIMLPRLVAAAQSS